MPAGQTPLWEAHKKLGAKMIDFGGWDMPASYQSVVEEHKHVRSNCGVFDVSHMGELLVSGPESGKFLQFATINDVNRLKIGNGQYTALLNHQGGFVDDLILYKIKPDVYLLCVNASNVNKDFNWLKECSVGFDCSVINKSDEYSQIAIQGPKTFDVIKLIDELKPALELNYMDIQVIQLHGQNCLIARTGYTGELGFEVYLPNNIATTVWNQLLSLPGGLVKPIGLGARDTLRLEACYLLYGNDISEQITPLEAGISWAIKLDKDFIGKSALVSQKETGVPRTIIGFTLEDKGIPRSHMSVYYNGSEIGKVTSGSMLPTLDVPGGMALVEAKKVSVGDMIEIDIRGKRKLAKVMKRPLYLPKIK